MAYSSMNADAGAEDDEPAVLGSGGAIMAALEQNTDTKHGPQRTRKTKLRQKSTKSTADVQTESDSFDQADASKSVGQSAKNNFMDSIVESTLTDKKTTQTKNHRKLNSYEQQQADEAKMWQEIAQGGVSMDKIIGEDESLPAVDDKSKKKLAQHKKVMKKAAVKKHPVAVPKKPVTQKKVAPK